MTSKIGISVRLCLRNRQLWTPSCNQFVRLQPVQSAVSNQVFTSLQYKNYCTTGASATPTNAQESRTAPQTENKDSQNEPPLSAEAKELEELKASHEKLSKEKEEAENKYLTALADRENVRQRLQKQVEDAKQFGIQKFCKDIVTVADTLRLASENIPAEHLKDPVVESMHNGLKLTEKQLFKVFETHGIKILNPKDGETFDPNLHTAVFQQPIPDKEPGTIFVVSKPGYTLNGRVLRAADVGVVQK